MAGIYDISFVGSTGTNFSVRKDLPEIDLGLTDKECYEAWVAFDTQNSFTEISNVVDGGAIGGNTEVQSESLLANGRVQKWLGAQDPGSIAITLGESLDDPGQILIRKLVRKRKQASFKVVAPNGRIFYFAGYITGAPTNIGTSDDYLSSSFNIEINYAVFDSEMLKDDPAGA